MLELVTCYFWHAFLLIWHPNVFLLWDGGVSHSHIVIDEFLGLPRKVKQGKWDINGGWGIKRMQNILLPAKDSPY